MSKEYLEAIERIKNKFINFFHEDNPDVECVEDALQRLESIDNANPSEALKELELVEDWIQARELKISNVIEPSLSIIKQYILKAQEQGKVLNELIKLVNNLEPTFNHKGIFSDTDIVGTIIKDYFYGNISASLKRIFKENKE